MKTFWISWWIDPRWSLFSGGFVCWCTGSRGDGADEEERYVALVQAEDEEGAKQAVCNAYDLPDEVANVISWWFCDEKPADWEPNSSRFGLLEKKT